MAPPTTDSLRDALDRDEVQAVLETLPEPDACRKGLCVDPSPADDTIRIDGTTRMSLLRIYSKVSDGKDLVGQIQVHAESGRPDTWSLHFYSHDVKFPSTEEHDDRGSWLEALRDLHDRRSDDDPDA